MLKQHNFHILINHTFLCSISLIVAASWGFTNDLLSIFNLISQPNGCPKPLLVRFLITVFAFRLFRCLHTVVNRYDMFRAL